ncbi:MAG: P63C domain-containing protein [Caedimonas sp.]|nr:P63C domain-containing protein [Caedimonas sp.]
MEQATHQGEIRIGEKALPCAVLSDGTRVITQKSVFNSFERPQRGQREKDKQIQLPHFMAAKNLLPYINQDITHQIQPLKYLDINGKVKNGYRAEILPIMCDIYLSARKDKVLTHHQNRLADIAEMIVRSLSKIGIIALIDEATGYQDVRRKDALQRILDAYLSKELSAWAKRFPDEFYDEIFRLKKWNWGIQKRPPFIGKITNDIVYSRLAPHILEELQKRNPVNDKGTRKAKHHQYLTTDVGHPALSQHIHALKILMKSATSWDSFYRLLQRSLPKKNEQLSLDLKQQDQEE